MNKKRLGIVFHGEKCIQCHACESACACWRGDEPGVRRRRVFQLWQGQYPQVRGRSGMAACRHCEAAACLEVCPKKALYRDEETGLVLLRASQCVGCRACLRACPYAVPQFGKDRVMVKCDLCFEIPALFLGKKQPCVATCPVKALELRWLEFGEETGLTDPPAVKR